jgi:hypothetical protein
MENSFTYQSSLTDNSFISVYNQSNNIMRNIASNVTVNLEQNRFAKRQNFRSNLLLHDVNIHPTEVNNQAKQIMHSINNQNIDENDSFDENEENDVNAKPTRGPTKLEFIRNSKVRNNRKSKRKRGLLNKLKEFDVITGSSSIFLSIGCDEDKSEA